MTVVANDVPEAFVMHRENDASGISGTGAILEGVIFSDGTVSTRWMTQTASTVIYNSILDFIKIHVYNHPSNNTELVFRDGTKWDHEYMKSLVLTWPMKHRR